MSRVVVLGGGIVGLSTAWALVRRGIRVIVIDTDLPGRSSTVAAGMISAAAEVDSGEPDLWGLTARSQQMWPDFAAEVEHSGRLPAGLRRTGTLLVAFDPDETARLDRRLHLLAEVGVRPDILDRAELRRREPGLGPGARAAAWLPDDLCVERHNLMTALRAALRREGAEFIDGTGTLRLAGARATGVEVEGRPVRADHVVLAAGWRSGAAAPAGVLTELTGPTGLRPVKGELLDLELAMPAIHATIRTRVDRVTVYLVPHDDHHLTVGATCENVGDDVTPTVRAAQDLLVAATTVVPELRDAAIVAHRVGLRPAMADNRPLLGDSPVPGLTVATGHYRHGFLLAPITAQFVADRVIHRLDEGDD